MTTSYAGDRLQRLAQAWLVATITSSALGVGLITAAGSVGQLLLPLGGVVAEQVDRRRALIVAQAIGASATSLVAIVVLAGHVAPWHIYLWALLQGLIHTVSRPAYKVVLTRAVPDEEVRSAVAINSATETSSGVAINAVGSLLLALVGLPIAFLLNVVSYLVAIGSLLSLPELGRAAGDRSRLVISRLLPDLLDGASYLANRPVLLHPLLLSFVTVALAWPVSGLLPAMVQKTGGSVVGLGMLLAASSAGSLAGAVYAGARGEGDDPVRAYSQRGLIASATTCVFVLLFVYEPARFLAALPLTVVGFVAFSEIVWNTSRVARLAGPEYQSRLQAITSMAVGLGAAFGMLWAGAAVDSLGPLALLGGSVGLGVLSAAIALRIRRPRLRGRRLA